MPIIVNKVEITDGEVHEEMQHHPAATVEGARHKAAQALVIRQLLLQEAVGKKLLDAGGKWSLEQEEAAIDALLKQEVLMPDADEEICRRYYQQNEERFIDKKTGKIIPFESVADHIRNYLYARSLQTGISQYIKILSGKARIAGFDMEENSSPLVQ